MSGLTIRNAGPNDLLTVLALLESGKEIMASSGNPNQWPKEKSFLNLVSADISNGNSYLVEMDSEAVATFAFIPSPEPTYARIEGPGWTDDSLYHVIHRIAKGPGARGIFRAVMDWCFEREPHIRIDTHSDNAIMQHCLESYGFTYCGIILLADGSPRLAYEKTR